MAYVYRVSVIIHSPDGNQERSLAAEVREALERAGLDVEDVSGDAVGVTHDHEEEDDD